MVVSMMAVSLKYTGLYWERQAESKCELSEPSPHNLLYVAITVTGVVKETR